MTIDELKIHANRDREELRSAISKAAYHRAAMWDAMREIEGILDVEFDTSETIETLASDIDVPAAFPIITDDDIDNVLHDIADLEED